jgi:hypothetical protein
MCSLILMVSKEIVFRAQAPLLSKDYHTNIYLHR